MIENVDIDKVTEKLSHIEDNVKKLEDMRCFSEEQFLEDYRNPGSAKYFLQVAIEAMIDITNHIIARNRLGKAETNKELFKILADNNIIDKKMVTNYSDMTKFRNKVVHLYNEIDDKQIYKILKFKLEDFYIFLDEINRALK
ncbi:MAG: hypothetical protein A2Y24_05465 [Clostridiales bacterium GWE2_32_10]|nr:MAG: hypothetical protein A2Y24_05465 [Clostridiales bacterium GWE2_32_10]HBY21622.1 DUF86 domain-containing protein [Clostridiales bacterium]